MTDYDTNLEESFYAKDNLWKGQLIHRITRESLSEEKTFFI
jgi:hypothetical protein